MAMDAGAEHVLPVHHQTFALSRESKLEPIERLLDAAGSEPDRVCLQEIGQEWTLR
jgi:L-ascorbate metabolism protein UlaG (beta-lactamase superfamily)